MVNNYKFMLMPAAVVGYDLFKDYALQPLNLKRILPCGAADY